MVLVRQMMLYSGRVVVVAEGDCVRAKVVVFRRKWLCSGKSCFSRPEVVVFGQKWLYLDKIVVFGKKLLHSGKMVVFAK